MAMAAPNNDNASLTLRVGTPTQTYNPNRKDVPWQAIFQIISNLFLVHDLCSANWKMRMPGTIDGLNRKKRSHLNYQNMEKFVIFLKLYWLARGHATQNKHQYQD